MYKKYKTLIKIIDFYIFSNIHVSIATFLLVKITLLNIGISENTTAYFVFFATILSYNFIRFFRFKYIKGWYQKWMIEYKLFLYLLSIFSFVAVLFLSFSLRLKSVFILTPFFLATLYYTFPLIKISLRHIPGLKIFLIAISWAGITVLFPLIQNYIIPRLIDYITFFQRFLFIIAITIPFDIRDIESDIEIHTLPQYFGIQKSKIIGIVLLVIFFAVEFSKPEDEQSLYSTLSIVLLSSILIRFSSKKQSKYYSAFFVESLPIIWFFLIYL